MSTVDSSDGTRIAYEKSGSGPPLVLVDGALCYRASGPARPLAELMSEHFTVYTYDRRGRGDSRDTQPYAVEREVDDLAAVIDAAGGSAHVYGISSGAALALEAARRGVAIDRLAMYEAPFIVDDDREPLPRDYAAQLDRLIAANRTGDAVRLFMRQVGAPRPIVALMRFMPVWKKLKGVAHTLAYDAAIMEGTQFGEPLPPERAVSVGVPTLVAVGGKSPDWMHRGMRSLADLLPDSEFRVVEGQTHMLKPKAIAPVLTEFLGSDTPARGMAMP